MNLGSLCSGIGGLELGVTAALGCEVAWQAEIDPAASAVLADHWPNVPNLGDIRDTSAMAPVDVLTAGYPCQPFSSAGQRKGTDDPRHLWPSVRNAVAHLGPRLVILENVRGHLTLGFDRVLGDLADLGYDAEWRLVRASDVGCCHQRARLFIAAYPDGERRQDKQDDARRRQPDIAGGGRGDSGCGQAQTRSGRKTAADASGAERGATQPEAVPAATPRPAEPGERRGPDAANAENVGRERGGIARDRGTGPEDSRFGPYAAAVRRQEQWHGPAPDPTTDGRLNPAFVEWMMGYPAGWVDAAGSRNNKLRCLGNAVVPQVAHAFTLGLLDAHREAA